MNAAFSFKDSARKEAAENAVLYFAVSWTCENSISLFAYPTFEGNLSVAF
jgi:hypothetical protein